MTMKQFGCWVVVGCLLALGQCGLYAQQSKISWSAHSSGFAVMTSGSVITKSSVGQMATGATMNSGIHIESGFLVDTTLRGLILAVQDEYELPIDYALEQNYPNPFNPATEIRFQIAELRLVSLKIYDVLGREVQSLVNEIKQPGTYTVRWDGREFPSGVYFCRIQAGSFTQSRKLLLLK